MSSYRGLKHSAKKAKAAAQREFRVDRSTARALRVDVSVGRTLQMHAGVPGSSPSRPYRADACFHKKGTLAHHHSRDRARRCAAGYGGTPHQAVAKALSALSKLRR